MNVFNWDIHVGNEYRMCSVSLFFNLLLIKTLDKK